MHDFETAAISGKPLFCQAAVMKYGLNNWPRVASLLARHAAALNA